MPAAASGEKKVSLGPVVDDNTLSVGSAVDCRSASSVERVAWVRSLLTSNSPSHRVEGLEEADLLESRKAGVGDQDYARNPPLLSSRRDAALLLGYLERMGEPYGPPEVCIGLFYETHRPEGIKGTI